MTHEKTAMILALAMSACQFDPLGEASPESSSGFTDSDASESTDPSVGATSLPPSTSAATQTSTDAGSSESSSSESSDSSTDPTFGDDATTTGQPIEDFALAFDGTSHARKLGAGGLVDWTAQDFTVELWIEIQDTNATGVIFDGSNPEFTSGWVLYLHAGFESLVFSFFDETHYNNVVVGPTVEAIGTGWHHIAATKSGGYVYLHIDGSTQVAQPVPTSVAAHGSTIWSLGGNTADLEGFRLKDAAIDDVRVTVFPRYDASNFDAPISYDDDMTGTMLLLRVNEGNGDVVSDDEFGYLEFSVEAPMWVPGNSE